WLHFFTAGCTRSSSLAVGALAPRILRWAMFTLGGSIDSPARSPFAQTVGVLTSSGSRSRDEAGAALENDIVTTREEARTIASDYLRQRGHDAGIVDVLAWDEIRARTLATYSARPLDLEACWICYLEVTLGILASSEIVVVSRV